MPIQRACTIAFHRADMCCVVRPNQLNQQNREVRRAIFLPNSGDQQISTALGRQIPRSLAQFEFASNLNWQLQVQRQEGNTYRAMSLCRPTVTRAQQVQYQRALRHS